MSTASWNCDCCRSWLRLLLCCTAAAAAQLLSYSAVGFLLLQQLTGATLSPSQASFRPQTKGTGGSLAPSHSAKNSRPNSLRKAAFTHLGPFLIAFLYFHTITLATCSFCKKNLILHFFKKTNLNLYYLFENMLSSIKELVFLFGKICNDNVGVMQSPHQSSNRLCNGSCTVHQSWSRQLNLLYMYKGSLPKKKLFF